MKKYLGHFFTYLAVIYFPIYMKFYAWIANNSMEFVGKKHLVLFVLVFHILPACLLALYLGMQSLDSAGFSRKAHTALLLLPLILTATTAGSLGLSPFLWTLAVIAIATVSGLLGYYMRNLVEEFLKISGYFVLLYIVYFFYQVGVFEEYKQYIAPDSPVATNKADPAKGNPPTIVIVFDEFSLPMIMGKDNNIGEEFTVLKELASEALWFKYAATNYDTTKDSIPSMLRSKYLWESYKVFGLGFDDFHEEPTLFDLAATRYKITILSAVKLQYCKGFADFECSEELEFMPEDSFLLFSKIFVKRFVMKSNFNLCRFMNYLLEPKMDVISNVNKLHMDKVLTLASEESINGRLIYLHFHLPHRTYKFDRHGGEVQEPEDGGEELIDKVSRKRRIVLFKQLQKMYYEQIIYTQKVLGEIIKRLKENGNWDGTNFVVTSDHGISWDVDNYGRRKGFVNDSIALIPMFIKPAGLKKGEAREDYYQHINFLPTMLDMMNLKIPKGLEGYSVLKDRKNLPYFVASGSKREELKWWKKDMPNGKWEETNHIPGKNSTD